MKKMGPMIDHIQVANAMSLEVFIKECMPDFTNPQTWTHPTTKTIYSLMLTTSSLLPPTDFTSCFNLIELTSGADYRASKDGWKPRSKRKEMALDDLKYILVKSTSGTVEGFISLMPTYEDDIPVIYCYEIHLSPALQGTGLGTILMRYLEEVAKRIKGMEKVMLTCFTRNERGVKFYQKLGFEKDEISPEPRVLRNGTVVEVDYVILSKQILK